MAVLRIQVLFHWESQEARTLARCLYRTFAASPTGEGPRIPVRYGPRQADDGPPPAIELSAENEIIVILVDERMARRARATDYPIADRWAVLVTDLLDTHRLGSKSPHRILPVALDAAALQLADALSEVSFIRLDVREGSKRDAHLIMHVAVRALRLLQNLPRMVGRTTDELPDIPVQLFISHAKSDLPMDSAAMAEGPVKAILTTLDQLPVSGWYDGAQIPPGGRFPDEIQRGVLNSSALVAVLTDAWSSREWCRREVLEAKLAGRPLLVLDALQTRVARLFPYVGNAMTLRWRAAISAPDEAGQGWERQRSRWEAEDAELVIQAALLEALRYQYDHRRLLDCSEEGDVVLGTPPEALTLTHIPAGTRRVWYPDPPLGREELQRLLPMAGGDLLRRMDLTTPLGQLARWKRPSHPPTVAVSLSSAPDTATYGGSSEHLATFADNIVLYLLIAGLRIAYGGVLGHDALENGIADGDDINYVERLLAMVRSHSVLLSDVMGASVHPIENWVAWPIHLRFGDAELRCYGREAVLKDLPRPPNLSVTDEELQCLPQTYVRPDTAVRRYAWARSLSFMRSSMQTNTSARIAMGGKLTGYQGFWPGVLEECVIALRARQPVYLLGLFGGAARLLVDALCGIERQELTNSWLIALPGSEELRDEYRRRGQPVQTPEELADELRRLGAGGLSVALNNGLSEGENKELIASDDPHRVVALILEGLRRKFVL